MKPNVTFNMKQMKDYIRSNKLNHPDVKLGMKRADMIAGLKKAGHWEEVKSKPQSVKAKVKAIEKKSTPKPAPKPAPKPEPKPEPKPVEEPAKKNKEDTKQAQKGENRIDFYGKNGDKERLIVKDDKTFDTIKNLLDKEGYIMTEKQEYLLKEGTIEYVKEQKTPARINIKPAKGKTDMMIISVEGHSFGQGSASIRIKKSVQEPSKPAMK